MKRGTRLGLWLLGPPLLAALLLAGWLATLDPTEHRARLQQWLSRDLGRPITLGGALSLHWWPRLELRASEVIVGNAPGFEGAPLLEIRALEFSVPTLSLLAGRLVMDTARLDGLTLRLTRDAEGRANWGELPSPLPRRDGRTRGLTWAGLALGGVDINDAAIEWRDERSGRTLRLAGMKAHTGPLAFDQPIEFSLSSAIETATPPLVGEAVATGTMSFRPDERRYRLEPFELTVVLRGQSLQGGRAALRLQAATELDLAADEWRLTSLSGEGLGLQLSGEFALSHLRGGAPGGQGALSLTSPDLGEVFHAFALPGADHLAQLPRRGLSLRLKLDGDRQQGELRQAELTAELPGVTFEAHAAGSGLDGPHSRLKASTEISGQALSTLLLIANAWQGGDDAAAPALQQALNGVNARDFHLGGTLELDLSSGRVVVPALEADLLGNTVRGEVTATGGEPGRPQFTARLHAEGTRLAALGAAYVAALGASGARIAEVGALLVRDGRQGLEFDSTLRADFVSDELHFDDTRLSLLGNTAAGTLRVTGLRTDSPVYNAGFRLEGPDLALLQGQLQALGLPLPPVSLVEKAGDWSLATRLETEPARSRLRVDGLELSALGVEAYATLDAAHPDQPDGSLSGQLQLVQRAPGALRERLPAWAAWLRQSELGLRFDGTLQHLTLHEVNWSSLWQGPAMNTSESLTLDIPALEIEPGREKLSLKEFTLRGPGLKAAGAVELTNWNSAAQWSGQWRVARFNPRETLARLGLPPPNTASARALRELGLETTFRLTSSHWSFTHLKALLDTTTLRGEIGVGLNSPPELQFDLDADELNLDRYLPAPHEALAVTTPELIFALAVRLPTPLLQGLKLDGDLHLDTLGLSGARFTGMKLHLAGADGQWRLDPAAADLYGGRYLSQARLDATASPPRLEVNASLAHVALEPLFDDLLGRRGLSGSLNFEARLSASGDTLTALRTGLSGQATFAVQNGQWRGLSLTHLLGEAGALLTGKAAPAAPAEPVTDFQAMSGTLELRDQAVLNHDLLLSGSGFRLTGSGTLVDFPSHSTQYDAKIVFDPSAYASTPLPRLSVPFHCRGEWRLESCRADLDSLLPASARTKVLKKIEPLLDGKARRKLKSLLPRPVQ